MKRSYPVRPSLRLSPVWRLASSRVTNSLHCGIEASELGDLPGVPLPTVPTHGQVKPTDVELAVSFRCKSGALGPRLHGVSLFCVVEVPGYRFWPLRAYRLLGLGFRLVRSHRLQLIYWSPISAPLLASSPTPRRILSFERALVFRPP